MQIRAENCLMYQVMLLQGIKRDLCFSAKAAYTVIAKEIVANNDIKVILLKISCIEFSIDVMPFLRLW